MKIDSQNTWQKFDFNVHKINWIGDGRHLFNYRFDLINDRYNDSNNAALIYSNE